MTRRLVLGTLVVVAIAAGPSNAVADDPTHGVEVRLWSLRAHGLAADYERLVTPRVSALGGLGLRSSAGGDYSGLASTLSLAGRYWLHSGGPSWMRAPLGGTYAEAIVDLQRTSVHDDVDDESLPSTYTAATGLGVGFRVVLAQRVSVTVHTSMAVRADIPRGAGRTDVRTTLRYGLRLGAVF